MVEDLAPTAQPVPAATDGVGLTESLHVWVNAAGNLDEYGLCLALVRALGDDVSDADRLQQAISLLGVGDAAGALRVLPSSDQALPTVAEGFRSADAIRAAARAALGDAEAHRWLLLVSAAAAGQPVSWLVTQLIAIAADIRGDLAEADRSWHTLLREHGLDTGVVVARVAAAHLHDRDGDDGAAVTTRVAEAALSLDSTVHRLEVDARPALAAANNLIRRGDEPAARVLVHLLPRVTPVAPAVRAMDAALNPPRMLWRQHAVVAALLAIAVTAVLLAQVRVPGGVLALSIVGGWAWRRWVRVPGLDRRDSVAFRNARQVTLHPGTGRPEAGTPDGGWLGLSAVIGSAAGLPLGLSVHSSVQHWGPGAVVLGWLAGLSVPVAALLLTRRWSRARQARRRSSTRAAGIDRAVREVGACQCWDSVFLVDEVAHAYADRHLVDVPDASVARAAAVATSHLGRTVRIRRCPSLGLLWLYASLTDDGAAALLRGALSQQTTAATTAEGTGLYL